MTLRLVHAPVDVGNIICVGAPVWLSLKNVFGKPRGVTEGRGIARCILYFGKEIDHVDLANPPELASGIAVIVELPKKVVTAHPFIRPGSVLPDELDMHADWRWKALGLTKPSERARPYLIDPPPPKAA